MVREGELYALLEPAAEAALVISRDGVVTYANPAIERMLGRPRKRIVGQDCSRLMQGELPETPVCGDECPVLQRAMRGEPVPAFDFEALTAGGVRKWLSVSTLAVRCGGGFLCLHFFRDVDQRLRVERAARRLAAEINEIPSDATPPAELPPLTEREQRVLEALSLGQTTRQIAETLGISPTTARNHIQHLLKKLDVHSRIEAVLRSSNRLVRPWTG